MNMQKRDRRSLEEKFSKNVNTTEKSPVATDPRVRDNGGFFNSL